MAILKRIQTGELQLIDKDSYRDRQIILRCKNDILVVKMIDKVDECTKQLRRMIYGN